METRSGSAVAFPGMGPNSFSDVAKFMLVNPVARELCAEADDVLGYSLVDTYRDCAGDYDEAAQVAFLVNCLALAKWAERGADMRADLCVGPSFGGKAAAVYSGALPFADAVWMTAQWARCLEEYFEREHTDVVTLSFVRTSQDLLDEILTELTDDDEWHEVSCHIDDDFHMLTLRERRLDWLQQRLRAAGGLPLYTMRPPMHCSVFGALRDLVDSHVISRLAFADPAIPVVADQDGMVLRTGAEVRTMLLDGFVRTMRWPSAVDALMDQGIGTVFVCGPDRLFGRVGITTRNFTVIPITPARAMRPRRRSLVT